MRIPFFHYKERDVADIAARATRVGSAEISWVRRGDSTRTIEESRAAVERTRRIRANGGPPS